LGGDLFLQPLQQGGVSIAGGRVRFDKDGNLTVDGNAVFNNGIYANIISPLPGQNLVIQLNNSQSSSESRSSMEIKNGSGSAVLSINSIGDLIASGSATISKLNFNLIPQAQAVSEIEVVATGSAGTTFINPYHREVTIDNTLVTKSSLIYISPVGQASQQPFLLRQLEGQSFTVGIKLPSDKAIQFNWLIVN
jgi:hypothetical protein